ncbi:MULTISPECIES: TetR/AcrR family transcriptional regulator [Niastella]|uniref:TetR/AcrR family transcriptional regulator n=1 Tax=Niastella soli TaxID=2821487 RepID=A0ABS3YY92_9BACT|nr:TetR/AcrR family transcriptional regulator [Niastella soli]MBO9202895.1 TetR/AcrR family transcriptional regulator [Niastella soli]
MSGRNRLFDEEKALAQAAEVFWIKGYEAASTEDLLTAMDLNKGSLYNAFGNKRELFIKVFDWFAQRFIRNMKEVFAKHSNTVDAIREIFLHVAYPDKPIDHTKGCFYVNILGETTGMDPDLEKVAREKLLDMEKLFHKELTKAQKAGQLTSTIQPSLLAKHLLNLWNGINISRRLYNEKELEKLVELNLQLCFDR